MVNFLSEARDVFPYTQEMRRTFHRHPELGFQETKTAHTILQELKKLSGLEIQTGIAETGITAFLEGDPSGPLILLRFDMDALPIQEESGEEYASQVEGVMHACGHDGHMAIGLSTAKILHDMRDELPGNILFVFQPAEEGLGGAKRMIEAGILQEYRPDVVMALHLWNEKPIGWFGISDGPMMAASEIFNVRIVGKGGHGANPHEAVDPILAASHAVTGLQSIVSRELSPLDTAVITVGSFHGGRAHNVIPSEVSLEGTIRTFNPRTRQYVLERFEEIVSGIAESHGCWAEIGVEEISPAVVNDPDIADHVRNVAQQMFPELTIDRSYKTMTSEDMALMMEGYKSCYVLIGSANDALGLNAKHHHPEFDFDERAMIHGNALISAAANFLLDR